MAHLQFGTCFGDKSSQKSKISWKDRNHSQVNQNGGTEYIAQNADRTLNKQMDDLEGYFDAVIGQQFGQKNNGQKFSQQNRQCGGTQNTQNVFRDRNAPKVIKMGGDMGSDYRKMPANEESKMGGFFGTAYGFRHSDKLIGYQGKKGTSTGNTQKQRVSPKPNQGRYMYCN